MPKPNYGFEKRQRELEKKRKKEDKALKKAAGPSPTHPDDASAPAETASPAPSEPVPPAN